MSREPKLDLPPKPEGKYSEWCEFKGMPPWDLKDDVKARQEIKNWGLSDKETAAYLSHKHMKTTGLEFTMTGNARFDKHRTFDNGLMVVPCFLSNGEGPFANKFVQKTMKMTENTLYEYDCWMPIATWDKETIRNSIRQIDEIMSCISLLAFTHFSWKPKYYYDQQTQEGLKYSTPISEVDIQKIQELYTFIDGLPEKDRKYVLGSIGWFAQSFRQTDNTSKFLFFMISIESLAHYLENETNNDSRFFKFKSKKIDALTEKREQNECIQKILDESEDLVQGLIRAKSNCEINGIIRTVKNSLSVVFPDEPKIIDLLFKRKKGKKCLYDIRSDIAHGFHKPLEPENNQLVLQKIHEIQNLAFRYIATVLK